MESTNYLIIFFKGFPLKDCCWEWSLRFNVIYFFFYYLFTPKIFFPLTPIYSNIYQSQSMCISCYIHLTVGISHTSEYSCYVWKVRLQPYHYMLKSEKDDFCVGSHTQGSLVSCEGPTTVSDHKKIFLFSFFERGQYSWVYLLY